MILITSSKMEKNLWKYSSRQQKIIRITGTEWNDELSQAYQQWDHMSDDWRFAFRNCATHIA